jgi:hypothetical protein
MAAGARRGAENRPRPRVDMTTVTGRTTRMVRRRRSRRSRPRQIPLSWLGSAAPCEDRPPGPTRRPAACPASWVPSCSGRRTSDCLYLVCPPSVRTTPCLRQISECLVANRSAFSGTQGNSGDSCGLGGDAYCNGLWTYFDFQAPRLFSISAVKFVGDWPGEAHVEPCPTCSFNER